MLPVLASRVVARASAPALPPATPARWHPVSGTDAKQLPLSPPQPQQQPQQRLQQLCPSSSFTRRTVTSGIPSSPGVTRSPAPPARPASLSGQALPPPTPGAALSAPAASPLTASPFAALARQVSLLAVPIYVFVLACIGTVTAMPSSAPLEAALACNSRSSSGRERSKGLPKSALPPCMQASSPLPPPFMGSAAPSATGGLELTGSSAGALLAAVSLPGASPSAGPLERAASLSTQASEAQLAPAPAAALASAAPGLQPAGSGALPAAVPALACEADEGEDGWPLELELELGHSALCPLSDCLGDEAACGAGEGELLWLGAI